MRKKKIHFKRIIEDDIYVDNILKRIYIIFKDISKHCKDIYRKHEVDYKV